MSQSGSLLSLIRARTRPLHARLEHRLQVLRAPSRPGYAAYLGRMYGLLAALEARVSRSPALAEWVPDVARRSGKARAIRADLAELGAGLHVVAVPALRCKGPAELLGFLYVTEGATLGGALVARELERALGPLPTRYLRCYGRTPAIHWAAFCQALERIGDGETRESVARGAEQGFGTVETWLDGGGLLASEAT